MEKVKIGSVVLSLSGRDQGRVMTVVSLDGKFALVADGRKRKIQNPKRKNLSHLRVLSTEDSCLAVNAELTNKRLWKALESYRMTEDN